MSAPFKAPPASSWTSRILPAVGSFAASFAATEVAAAMPHVKAALDAIPADLKASKPLVAFAKTLQDAASSIANDPAITPSLTGLLGALAKAWF